jgi:hypothetical protein
MNHRCAWLGMFDFFGWPPADDMIQNLKFALEDYIQYSAIDIHKAIGKPTRPAEDKHIIRT